MTHSFHWTVGQALMRASRSSASVAMCLLAGLSQAHLRAQTSLPLRVIADVPLGGQPTRLDYASVDPGRHRLYIAHLGDSNVIVVDTQALKVVAHIRYLDRVHGVLAVPALDRVFASATGTDEVVSIDANGLTPTARTPAGRYPDGMAYAPKQRKLYVSDETGGTDTAIDVRTGKRVATISLGGEAGNTQYDPVSGHIFVNVQTRGKLVEIDPQSDRIVRAIDLPGAQGNHGLLIDAAHRLAFIACEGNRKLLVLNLRTMTIASSFAVGAGPDVLAYDAHLGLLFVASESGVLTVFRVAANGVSMDAQGYAGPNAHVIAVDPVTHRIYMPLKNVKGRPMLRVLEWIGRRPEAG